MSRAYLLFHLNLAYSSIPAAARPEVIRRCYRPLLQLVETTGIPIGIEVSGWSLRQIQALDPGWVADFRRLLQAGRCELVGSGYAQLIGPLVPYEINVWNQRLGLADYRDILDVQPRLALVNEMAYSTGLVDVYRTAGYHGIVMDRDNVRLALGLQDQPVASAPTHALGANGESLPVLWSDSILFQKLQRYAHGDIALADYLDYFRRRAAGDDTVLCVYCNDAEVFDYRPGRFREESALNGEGEWRRIERLLRQLGGGEDTTWLAPSAAIAQHDGPPRPALLTSVAQPVPVKKQAKYNISRWAVTGRNDIWLNTACYRLYQRLRAAGEGPDAAEHWRALCELWASDLRTHITPERWQQARHDVDRLAATIGATRPDSAPAAAPVNPQPGGLDGFEIGRDEENILLTVRTPSLRLVLNMRRGLTIHALGFRSHEYAPAVGTLPHGFFSSIELGADYYSGGVIVEQPAEHRRITDLERVEPEVIPTPAGLDIVARIETACGPLVKRISVDRRQERVTLGYSFPGWLRPHGTVRAGLMTVLPGAFEAPLTLQCSNGGSRPESFVLDRACDHAGASSGLVSCTTGFGATTGSIVLGDRRRRVSLAWDPGESAVFPMLVHRPAHPHPLTRVVFSLAELDDTSRPEGSMLGFRLQISPA